MPRSLRRSRSVGGFALFEVLVSTVILSAGCIVLIQALAAAMKAARTLQDRYLAASALEDALWTLERSGGSFDVAQARTPDGLKNVDWTAEPGAALNGELNQTKITIRWTSPDSLRDGRREDLELSTYDSADETSTPN